MIKALFISVLQIVFIYALILAIAFLIHGGLEAFQAGWQFWDDLSIFDA
jgi:hypothetical protein